MKLNKTKNKNIGIKEIAAHANVSTGPVDKVLNNRGGVSKATHARILKAIEELNYKPNMLASRLKSKKQFTIAILIPKATEAIPFWYAHNKGFEQALEEFDQFGLNIDVLTFDQNSESSFNKNASKIIKGKYDGIFMVPIFYDQTVKLLAHFKSSNIPIIFFDSNISSQNNISFIGQHSRDSGYLSANILSRCILSTDDILIASISSKEDNHIQFSAREEGFRSFFAGSGRKIYTYENKTGGEGDIETEIVTLLKNKRSIRGIFATNGINKIAAVINGLRKKDFRLIGYDLIDENIFYLELGIIDFLVSQQPDKQAYNGIRLFYEYLILKQKIQKSYYMPLDIVMKANLKYYL